MSHNKENQKNGKRYIISILTLLLVCCLFGCGASDNSKKEQAEKAFQETFNQSYLLPDELGKDKTVVELLDVLCGDESVFYLKRDDGMIDVTYQAKTVWMDKDTDVKFSLELDPENYTVTPVSMTLDKTEMEPRFMDAFLLQCAGYDTLAQEVLDQWANGQSESYFEEVAAEEERAKEEAEGLEQEFLAELESIKANEAAKEEDSSIKAISECTALEFYTILQENGVADYTLNDKAIEFLSNHNDFFPLGDNVDSWDFIDWELSIPQVMKSPGRYGDKMMDVLLQVVQINEVESHNEEYFTTIIGSDYDGNLLYLVYKGELPEIFDDDYIEVIGLPLGVVTYETLNNGNENAVLIAVSDAFLNNGDNVPAEFSLDAAYDFAAWCASDVGSWYSETTGYYVIPYIDDGGNAAVEFATENTMDYYAASYYVDGIKAARNEQGGLTYQGLIYEATKEEQADAIGTVELIWDSEQSIESLSVTLSTRIPNADISVAADDYIYYGIVDYD